MTIEDLALIFIRGLGSRGAARLVEHFGTAERIYATPQNRLIEEAGIKESIATQIASGMGLREAEREISYARKHDIRIISATDSDYPAPLLEAVDRPHVLFVQGNVEALSRRTLSMVGTREASPSGLHIADRLVGELSERVDNLSIVSGLAYGIDSACHRAALNHGATTVAVVATVLPEISPAPHRTLANEILNKGGAIVSELHSQTHQNGALFMARNRIIAALSMGLLVVESPASGGSLATAEMADSYGRTVMAIPGRITDTSSFGSNNLIRSGKARLVLTASDIIEDMDWPTKAQQSAPAELEVMSNNLSEPQQRVMECFNAEATISRQQLLEMTKLSMGELAMVIMDLELMKLIRPLPGQRYERI